MPRALPILLLCIFASSASAQIVYEPVRYQYGGQIPFYYGGHNPDMFRFADCDRAQSHNGFVEAHGDVQTHREVSDIAPRVYVDQIPRCNAATYGCTAADAQNAAYQNAPCYFSKRDSVAGGETEKDDSLRASSRIADDRPSGTIEIKPYVRPAKRLNSRGVGVPPARQSVSDKQ